MGKASVRVLHIDRKSCLVHQAHTYYPKVVATPMTIILKFSNLLVLKQLGLIVLGFDGDYFATTCPFEDSHSLIEGSTIVSISTSR